MEQKPSVGRIVHYQSYGTPNGEHKSLPRAAVITAIREDGGMEGGQPGDGSMVDLAVLNPEGMFFNRGVWFSETPTPGHWNWPPRV